ncbi:sugar ABC transporter substrate-binding protein [Streptomyces mirabilis]|uniref:sugar ABC transporter substrate-binding protein n=1 Tax=Streptomyces mirabilis TaxID=68239 RepID=UPI00369A063C
MARPKAATRGRRFVRAGALAAVLALTTALTAGCNGGKSTDSANTSSGATSAELAKADSLLKPFLERPRTIALTEPLKKLPTGKILAYLECTADPCKILGQSMGEAAKALGMRYEPIQAGATPESFQAAAQQAVDERPAAVLMAGLDSSLIKSQLAEMKAKGIKTVDFSTADNPSTFDAFFLSSKAWYNVGAAEAAYAIKQNRGKAHVLFVNMSLFTLTKGMKAGLEDTVKNDCAGCSIQTIDTMQSDVGTQVPSKVVSALQQDPSINTVVFMAGYQSLGVPEALKAAGLADKVKIIVQAPSANSYADLKTGTQEAATDVDLALNAYYAVDAAARLVTGQKTPDLSDLQMHYLITGKDVTFDPKTEYFHPIPDYKEQFHKIWGLK